MINGLEGIPGSGKSYEAVTFHVLHALKAGRLVITNLPLQKLKFAALDESFYSLIELRHKPLPVLGTWDADRVDVKGNGLAFDLTGDAPGQAVSENGVFGSVWDFYTNWKHPITGQGPLFVIDECHVCFPRVGMDAQVVEWFKLHRHFNCDVLIATQNFRDVNQPIANLLAMLVKVRNADILTGDRSSYIRKVHAGFRGAAISTEVRKYNPEFFQLYKSHSQGNSVSEASASDVKPFLLKFQRFTRVFVALTIGFCVYAAWGWYHKGPVSPSGSPALSSTVSNLAPLAMAAPAAVPAALAGSTSGAGSHAQAMVVTAPGVVPEPFQTKGIHLTGRMTLGARTLYTFALSLGNSRAGAVSSDELRTVGYVWEPLTDCIGVLRWKDTAKTVTCDAPIIPEGSGSMPVVIAMAAGSVAPAARSDALPSLVK